MKRLVLLGGGHAHIEVLRSLALEPLADVEVTLVTPHARLLYTGMVPGVIAGHYALADAAVDLAALARAANATVHLTTASMVSPVEREVTCSDASVVAYDVLSFDVGSCAVLGEAAGVARHAVVMRPLEGLVRGWADVRSRALEGRVKSVTVVGAGAAGIELALAMDYGLRRGLKSASPHVRILTESPVAVPEFNEGARARLKRNLAKRNIGLHVSSQVGEIGGDYVRLASGLEFASDATFWATGAGSHEWIRQSGFATDKRGFLLVNDFLQSVTFREVFGAGDCVAQENHPLPRAGVFAVRAAPTLAANLRATLAGGALERHVTSPRFLALVSTGSKRAVGVWGEHCVEGVLVWRWKDAIDRKFVARYERAAG
ncbi:MAG TPA: FAD-dependent oxidoreductase [Usitatibacter sp.]|nr:FAD-dependent oxidoreductase [Usitatibacter sp.]